MIGIGFDDETGWPGLGAFLLYDKKATTVPSSDASSAVGSESARECHGTICAFIQ
jgi:hypothetical protein